MCLSVNKWVKENYLYGSKYLARKEEGLNNSSVSKMLVLQTWDLYSMKNPVTIISICNLSAGAAEKGRFYRACWADKLAYLVGSKTERQLVSLNNVHIIWGIISQATLQFPDAHIHMYTTQHINTHTHNNEENFLFTITWVNSGYIILGKINHVHTHKYSNIF